MGKTGKKYDTSNSKEGLGYEFYQGHIINRVAKDFEI
jgi:hypothetical protein